MVRQILRHALGEGGYQHPLVPCGTDPDLLHQIVDLAGDGPHLHTGVQQACGADHLLHDLVGSLPLVLPRRGGDEHRLTEALLELRELQGAVIIGAGQTEAVLHQALLPGPVAVIHGPHLRQGHMALVHKEDKILREVVQQRGGRRARLPAGDDPAVILDAGAVAQLPHHLHIVAGALVDALGLDELAVILEVGLALRQLPLDLLHRPLHLLLGGDVVAGGVNGHVLQHPLGLTGDGVDLRNAVDLVPKELHPDGVAVGVHRVNLHRVPPDPEHIALEGHVVAVVADLHQLPQQLIPWVLLPLPQGDDHVGVVDGVPQAVDAGHRRHHDDVPPLKEGCRGAVAQALDLGVDGGVLLDEGIRVGDVRLRLIVVVVGDEVLHGVFREELPELLAQLGRQRLVVGQHQRGALHLLDDLGHGVGLAAAGDAQQHLLTQAVLQSLRQLFDGLRLVAGGGIFRNNFELGHGKRLLQFQCVSLYFTTKIPYVNMNFETNVLILWRENMAAPRSIRSGALR